MYVADSDPHAPAFLSKYCAGRFRCSSHFTDESVGELLELGDRIGQASVLIPANDEAAFFVADHDEPLRKRFIFPKQSANVVSALCSKKDLYYMAKAHDVPTPEISFPQSREELLSFLRRATFPIVLKAAYQWRFRPTRTGGSLLIVKTERELLNIYDAIGEQDKSNLVLQEYVPGGDDTIWMFNGYFNESSDCLFGLTGKKIHQWPVHRGMTSLGICLRNGIVEQTTKRFMKAIGYRGILDIGYRYDARDGKYKLLDVNPRLGAAFRLFVTDNGMDVTRALYMDMTGQLVVPGFACDGRKWLVEDFELHATLSYVQQRELTFGQLRKSYRGVRETAYFAADDLIPFLRMPIGYLSQTRFARTPSLPFKRRTGKITASSS